MVKIDSNIFDHRRSTVWCHQSTEFRTSDPLIVVVVSPVRFFRCSFNYEFLLRLATAREGLSPSQGCRTGVESETCRTAREHGRHRPGRPYWPTSSLRVGPTGPCCRAAEGPHWLTWRPPPGQPRPRAGSCAQAAAHSPGRRMGGGGVGAPSAPPAGRPGHAPRPADGQSASWPVLPPSHLSVPLSPFVHDDSGGSVTPPPNQKITFSGIKGSSAIPCESPSA